MSVQTIVNVDAVEKRVIFNDGIEPSEIGIKLQNVHHLGTVIQEINVPTINRNDVSNVDAGRLVGLNDTQERIIGIGRRQNGNEGMTNDETKRRL